MVVRSRRQVRGGIHEHDRLAVRDQRVARQRRVRQVSLILPAVRDAGHVAHVVAVGSAVEDDPPPGFAWPSSYRNEYFAARVLVS